MDIDADTDATLNMQPLLYALYCEECFMQNTLRIIQWIARRHHTYPKTKKGWYNQIATQFCYYREHGRTIHIPYDPYYMINWLISQDILRAGFGRRLRLRPSLGFLY